MSGPPQRLSSAPMRPLPATPATPDTESSVIVPAAHLAASSGDTSSTKSIGSASNPFNVDLVLPFSIAGVGAGSDYERLIAALHNEGGLRVTARPGQGDIGSDEIWVFVAATDAKMSELIQRERITDEAHGMRVETVYEKSTPAARIRLLYELLTSPKLQHGLGITPGEGQWVRVKSIVALHDDEQDAQWVERWTIGGDWQVGLLKDLKDEDGDILGRNQVPAVRLYFNYLTTYTLSLLPIAAIGLFTWLKSPADSYPPLFAFCLSLYACCFIAFWRIRERKLAVHWGARGCESVSVQLRPQYCISNSLTAANQSRTRTDLIRDGKVFASIPIILACGAVLACVLMCIFMIEAFVGHLWTGRGSSVLPYIPMVLFSLVVPQVVTLFNGVSANLVKWEDHPTFTGAQKSLTAKTFAMNTIVAYMGLFLTAYVYLPFGPYLMAYIHNFLSGYQGTPDKSASPSKHHENINVARLKGQMFAYMVTNQVINTFLELGLPYIIRFVNDVRSGKTSIADVKDMFKKEDELTSTSEKDDEKRFLNKVQHELELPPYNIFTDYAEMVTQFGYVVVWGLVWPLAPVFALINNYFELRSDALKICKHVQRPIGGRVESIGTWIDTLGIIAWVGAWASTTLVYLFRPHPTFVGKCNATLAAQLASYDTPPTFRTVLPSIMPVVLAALAASHGYFVLRAIVTAVAERVFWRGSPEQLLVSGGASRAAAIDRKVNEAVEKVHAEAASAEKRETSSDTTGFWTSPQIGADVLARAGKKE